MMWKSIMGHVLRRHEYKRIRKIAFQVCQPGLSLVFIYLHIHPHCNEQENTWLIQTHMSSTSGHRLILSPIAIDFFFNNANHSNLVARWWHIFCKVSESTWNSPARLSRTSGTWQEEESAAAEAELGKIEGIIKKKKQEVTEIVE